MTNNPYRPRDWDSHPPIIFPDYKSTVLRNPQKPLIPIRQSLSETTGPVYGDDALGPLDHDLTKNAAKNGEPIGERIIVTGRVVDEDGRAVANTLIEIWQANAAGRYIHVSEVHDAPLDPNFLGAGRFLTDENGQYRFITIKPGSYPWGNHLNAWRPAHIHFSLFGPAFASRLVTQMYFEGDPTFPFDPIFNSVPEGARERLVAKFSMDLTEPDWAHAYVFDIVLRGRHATPMEAKMAQMKQTPSQTLGPFFAYGLTPEQYGYAHKAIADNAMAAPGVPGEHIRIEGRIFDGAGAPIDDAMIEIWQADANGRYAGADGDEAGGAGFSGFGRCGTDDEGGFWFTTIKPGAIGDGQAPHIGVIVQARGILNHAFTRIYFADEADANGADRALQSVPGERRHTLIATRSETPAGPAYRFDIHMQGDDETVFFDV